jgi:rhodanese-related sulfurtransferase
MLKFALLSLIALADSPKSYPNPAILIEVSELANLSADKTIILDARSKTAYLEGHIREQFVLIQMKW